MKLNPHGDGRDLRDHGAHEPGIRGPSAPLCGFQGKLRQGVFQGYGLRRLPIHRGQARPHLCRAVPGHRQGHGGFCPQLRQLPPPSRCCCPRAFPTVLVNSNVGIAVSMASSICSFNLKEVCETTIGLLKDPEFDVSQTLKGPDFPGGGLIVHNQSELEKIYRTGRGSVKVRRRYTYDKQNNCIEITEIPPTTTVEADHGQDRRPD